MDLERELYALCEMLERELMKTNDKLEKSGNQLTGSDIEYIDKLTHSIKSVKTTLAMIESEGMSFEGGSYARGGQGGRQGGGQSRRSYAGRSYEQGGGSYARGRGRNARRDSMGRYADGGYSGNEEMISELHELMEDAPDEKTRMEFQKFIQKIENM